MLGFVVLRFFSSIPAITSMLGITSIPAVTNMLVVAMDVSFADVSFASNLLSCPDSSLRSCLDSSSPGTSGGVEVV